MASRCEQKRRRTTLSSAYDADKPMVFRVSREQMNKALVRMGYDAKLVQTIEARGGNHALAMLIMSGVPCSCHIANGMFVMDTWVNDEEAVLWKLSYL
jgi:hypothetical protein